MTEVATLRQNRRPSLKEEVARHIRDAILSGALRPAERLDQDALADELGVSRLPIREALILLEAEGLVNNVPRRGSFVARLEEVDILDHFAMFGAISAIAAARVAANPNGALIAELREISARMRKTTDPVEHDRLNLDFHQLINKAGGSRRLRSVLRMLSESMPTHFFTEAADDFRERAFDEHDAIVHALESGDAALASSTVYTHFIHTGEQAVRRLQAAKFWDRGTAARDD